MRGALLFLCSVLSIASAAPLYGVDGGYKGYASYVPFRSPTAAALSRRRFHSEDSIDTSAGSPDVISRPHREEDSSAYEPNHIPKKYDVLDYTPNHQHGYGGNKISEDTPEAPYHRATLYGQSQGGYKIADAYQNQHVDSHEDDESDYIEEHLSHPQPYEFGYALKDEHGNMQHKHETSDGHGNVKGSYGFTDEHGLYRSVEYVAGKDGFKASIKTNEPGTENQNPADVYVQAEKPEY